MVKNDILNINKLNKTTVQPLNRSTVQHNYCTVIVNIKGLGVKTFSYLIPDEMKDKLQLKYDMDMEKIMYVNE